MATASAPPRSSDAAAVHQLPPIRSSDRCCFFGRTGAGKTTLARAYLRAAARYVVLDPKRTYRAPGVPLVAHYEPRRAQQIVRPGDRADEREVFGAAIDGVWKSRNRILYIDELTLVQTSSTKVDWDIGRAIRTGRERNVGVWMGSQRPKDIPSAVFTEAEHFFIFRLQWKEDRKKVAEFTGDTVMALQEGLSGHQFVYYNVRSDTAVVMELVLRSRGE